MTWVQNSEPTWWEKKTGSRALSSDRHTHTGRALRWAQINVILNIILKLKNKERNKQRSQAFLIFLLLCRHLRSFKMPGTQNKSHYKNSSKKKKSQGHERQQVKSLHGAQGAEEWLSTLASDCGPELALQMCGRRTCPLHQLQIRRTPEITWTDLQNDLSPHSPNSLTVHTASAVYRLLRQARTREHGGLHTCKTLCLS